MPSRRTLMSPWELSRGTILGLLHESTVDEPTDVSSNRIWRRIRCVLLAKCTEPSPYVGRNDAIAMRGPSSAHPPRVDS